MDEPSPNKPDRANRRQPLDLGETVGEAGVTGSTAAVAHPERWRQITPVL